MLKVQFVDENGRLMAMSCAVTRRQQARWRRTRKVVVMSKWHKGEN